MRGWKRVDVEKSKTQLVQLAKVVGVDKRFEENPNVEMPGGFDVFYRGLLDELVSVYGPKELDEMMVTMLEQGR